MKIDGNCHCGQVGYQAEIDSPTFSICHCIDCQRMTGAGYSAVVHVPIEKFILLSGVLTKYVKRTADSGAENISAFCTICGARIYSCAKESPKDVRVRLGTINQRAALTPILQIWRRSALSWVDDVARIPACDRGPVKIKR